MVTGELSGTGRQIITFFGLAADTKPTGNWNVAKIENGSKFYEMDSGNVYMFDEENQVWLLQE